MENLFYASPENFIDAQHLEIKGQEAQHISRVLRNEVGDEIHVANGKGRICGCTITGIAKNLVTASIQSTDEREEPVKKKVLALGLIKKRDRLEYAVEKAVEVGAWEICLFNADHSERSKLNMDRLQSLVISAFKQSWRYWLPEILYLNSVDEVFKNYQGYKVIMAHMEAHNSLQPELQLEEHNLLLVGPEGGFSDREVGLAKVNSTELVSLGENRLRAETAAVVILSKFL